MKSVIGRPSSLVVILKSSDNGGVKRLMRRVGSRNSVPKSVAAIRFCRSLWARDTLSSLSFSSLLTVCSSSLIDCSSSLLVSSSSEVDRYSSLIDCSSSFAARSSSLAAFRLLARHTKTVVRELQLFLKPLNRFRRPSTLSQAQAAFEDAVVDGFTLNEQHQRIPRGIVVLTRRLDLQVHPMLEPLNFTGSARLFNAASPPELSLICNSV